MVQSAVNEFYIYSRAHRSIYRLGALACLLLILYSLATILIVLLIGGPPATAKECFSMLQQNRLHGLLRLDLLTVFVMPFYYLLFYSIYCALRDADHLWIVFYTLLVFTGVTLFLACPSVFSYLHLSDQYAAATDAEFKSQLIAAGEAILATDIWHGTGARVGGILLQSGALLLSIAMLKGTAFNKLTAYTGILTHGLDLLHVIIGFLSPTIGVMLMAIAGPLYLLWFPFIGWRLYLLSKK